MSASDKIKDALVAAYPNTVAKDWKRRSKSKSGTVIVRNFEHADYGTIPTFEDETGMVSLKQGGTIAFAGDNDAAFVATAAKATLRRVSADEQAAGVEPLTKPVNPNIEVGDKVSVAKDSVVLTGYFYDESPDGVTVAQRATSVTVATIIDKPKNWVAFLPQEERDKIETAMRRIANGYGANARYLLDWIRSENERVPHGWDRGPKVYSTNAGVAKALMDAQAVYRSLYGENPRFVVWGSGGNSKATFIGNVTKVADAAAVKEQKKAAPQEKAITKRRLMVEGSKWRFTTDCPIVREVRNPEIDKLCAQRDAIYRSENSQTRMANGTIVIGLGGGRGNTPSEKAEMAKLQERIVHLTDNEPTVKKEPFIVPAGTEFTVTGKLSSEIGGWHDKTKGLRVPCDVDKGSLPKDMKGWNCSYALPYNQIEKAVEPLAVPEAIVYVLRDRATGEFFGGWETSRESGWNRSTDVPKMSGTFSGAKKYKTSSAVKASIRDFVGYNDGLNDDGEYAPEWASGGQKKMDLPPTWEMVAIDKTTNAEKEVIDVQDWLKGLMRLRDLTQKHCSAVRGAYKKAETDGLDQYEAIVLFQNRESGSYQYKGMAQPEYYDNALPFEEENDGGKAMLAAIKAAGDAMGGKKIRVKTQSAVAYACSLDDAVTAKMMMSFPNVTTRLLDIKTLEDIVREGEAAGGGNDNGGDDTATDDGLPEGYSIIDGEVEPHDCDVEDGRYCLYSPDMEPLANLHDRAALIPFAHQHARENG